MVHCGLISFWPLFGRKVSTSINLCLRCRARVHSFTFLTNTARPSDHKPSRPHVAGRKTQREIFCCSNDVLGPIRTQPHRHHVSSPSSINNGNSADSNNLPTAHPHRRDNPHFLTDQSRSA